MIEREDGLVDPPDACSTRQQINQSVVSSDCDSTYISYTVAPGLTVH